MGLTNHKLVPFNSFMHEITEKKQIYLHHTAGGPDAEQVYKWWDMDARPVATCVVVGRNGLIAQGFHSMYWAYHLGLSNQVFSQHHVPYKSLDKISLGIEICSYGWVEYKNGAYYNYVNGKISANEVVELDSPFRGRKLYQGYTDQQIDSVLELLQLWKTRYSIDISYKSEQMWDISKKALMGENGLYTHCSVRGDKSDIFPDPKLITALKSL